MKVTPKTTTVQGAALPWDEEIETLWVTHIEPLFEEGQTCLSANFYRPRRYQDTHFRGSVNMGFVYIVMPGRKVHGWSERILDKPLGTPEGGS